MDQMFFSLKRAHHATLGFTRPILKRVGLTPTRFDLLTALEIEQTQLGVQRRLGLAKATISEMLCRLEELGLIWRQRWRRTKVVGLTKKAKELLQRAYDLAINPGHVPLLVDAVLAWFNPERDPLSERFAFESFCAHIRRAFGERGSQDLYYGWHPDEWLNAILDPNDPDELARFSPK